MYEKLVNYAAKQLELDASEITPDSTFESLGIDSLDIVEMIMDLESELGIELDLESDFAALKKRIDRKEVTREELVSLRSINGQSKNVRMIIKRWRDNGMIQELEDKSYIKTSK